MSRRPDSVKGEFCHNGTEFSGKFCELGINICLPDNLKKFYVKYSKIQYNTVAMHVSSDGNVDMSILFLILSLIFI